MRVLYAFNWTAQNRQVDFESSIMSENKVALKFAQIRLRGKHGLQRLDEHSHGWLGMIFSAINQTLNPNTATTAAAIAYFSLLSLFPIVLLSISIASFSLGPRVDQHVILQKLEFIAPALSQLLGNNIDEIIHQSWTGHRACANWSGLVCLYGFLYVHAYVDRDLGH